MTADPDAHQTSQPGSRARRVGWWVVGVTLVALVGLYVAGWFVTGNRVPNGTTVMGVDIGGLRAVSAQTQLEDELGAVAARPIRFRNDGQILALDPAKSGLSLDFEATVRDSGGGRSWNPIRMLDLLFGSGGAVEPVVSVDDRVLETAVADISIKVNTSAVAPSVTYAADGTPKVVEPVVGVELDEDATQAAVVDAYPRSVRPVRLPVDVVEPSVGTDEFAAAKKSLVEPAVSGPITLQLPGGRISLPVRAFAPALRIDVADGELVASVDAETLAKPLEALTQQIADHPKDASVVLRGNRPVVIPDRPGVALDPELVADAITPVLTEASEARVVTVGTATARADFTTAEARALEITERVSEFVTYFPYAEYRNINQGRAAELIDGRVLKPGETFSFNDTVGERTQANGFVKGFVISNGVFAEELGGGVSQVVTTTYNAAFFAGLQDVEHTPHSFYIDRYPLGREATVAWPTVDLKFANDTPHGVLIHAWVVPGTLSSSGEMHVEMYSTKYWDITAGVSDPYNFTSPDTRYDPSGTCVANTGYGGFDVDVYRSFRKVGSNQLAKKETRHVAYTPSDSVICTS
ncbi:MAG: VanW family protein [Propionibacteriales bacterium]|nr:VanW family protein [Propionibacteriales bacterium]